MNVIDLDYPTAEPSGVREKYAFFKIVGLMAPGSGVVKFAYMVWPGKAELKTQRSRWNKPG
jgi:hypothetical protein